MKLTIETLKKLIKEELNLLESQYGEEFNPQMKLPPDHEGNKITSWKGSELGYHKVLDPSDDRNEAIYESYAKKLIQHSWTIDMIIEGAVEKIKESLYEMMQGMEIEDIANSYIFIDFYDQMLNTARFASSTHHSHRLLGLGLAYIQGKKAEEYFPIPDHLAYYPVAGILAKENPNNLNDDIVKECKRMFYFIKDLYGGKLDGMSPEMQKTAINNIETFNQLLASYDGPAPEDSYERKD